MFDDISDADLNAINGLSSPSDYDTITGGTYAAQQDPFTAADDGTVNNAVTGSGRAAPTATAPAGGSATTTPSWLSTLNSLAGSAGNIVTTVAPIVNGKPATSPGSLGAAPRPGASTVPVKGAIPWNWIGIGAAVLAVLGLLLWKRK